MLNILLFVGLFLCTIFISDELINMAWQCYNGACILWKCQRQFYSVFYAVLSLSAWQWAAILPFVNEIYVNIVIGSIRSLWSVFSDDKHETLTKQRCGISRHCCAASVVPCQQTLCLAQSDPEFCLLGIESIVHGGVMERSNLKAAACMATSMFVCMLVGEWHNCFLVRTSRVHSTKLQASRCRLVWL